MTDSPLVLTAEDRESIAQLQWIARRVVEGIHEGRHRSPHKGTSAEFKEHRAYVRGDESRAIDWKLFGKTDRLYIRQYEDETNFKAMLLVDQSGSMGYSGTRASGVSKHQFAVRLAACVATLLIAQQDAVGLGMFDTELREVIPARSRTSHLQPIFTALAQSRTAGETHLHAVLQQTASRLKRRGLLILISDLFDEASALLTALKHFRHSGSEVIVFQVWDRDELEFPFRSRTEFRSLELAGKHRIVEPRAVRGVYLKRVEDFQQQLEQGLAQAGIEWIPCTSDESYTTVLSRYIHSRRRRRQPQSVSSRNPNREATRRRQTPP